MGFLQNTQLTFQRCRRGRGVQQTRSASLADFTQALPPEMRPWLWTGHR